MFLRVCRNPGAGAKRHVAPNVWLQLVRKVHETSDLTDTYVDEDGVRCRGFCGAYVDDLIVFSRNADEHKRHLTTLFEVLSKENLYLNTDK